MYQRIVVGTDGSDTADRAVHHGFHLAKVTGGTVHLATAWQPMPALALTGQISPAAAMAPDDGAWVEQLHRQLAEEAASMGVTTQSHSLQGPAAQSLLDLVTQLDADLVIVGNAGMHGLRGHLASVPNTIAHKAPCAVLLVPTS
jgi:nucleotide-binding universal stress UspA family protein